MSVLKQRSFKKGATWLILFMWCLGMLLTTLPTPLKAVETKSIHELALNAVQNQYGHFVAGQTTADTFGAYGCFSAHDLFILNQAGVDYGSWSNGGTTLQELGEAYLSQLADPGQSPSAKALGQGFLLATATDHFSKDVLLTRLVEAQKADGSFDYNVYSNIAAYDALSRSGSLNQFNLASATDYLFANQDPVTGAWFSVDEKWDQDSDGNWFSTGVFEYAYDVMMTNQAIRTATALLSLFPEEGDALEAAMLHGLNWLAGLQAEDGSLPNSWDDPFVNAAESLVTLLGLPDGITGTGWDSGAIQALKDYVQFNGQNADGTFGASKNLTDDTAALEAYLKMGAALSPEMPFILEADPLTLTLLPGESSPLTARQLTLGGTWSEVTDELVWTSSLSSVVAIGEDGQTVLALAPGEAVLEGAWEGLVVQVPVTVTGTSSGGGSQVQGTRVNVKVTGRDGGTLYNQAVTLSNASLHGITALGALHQTGLSYDYDSLSYIHTIAGQGPQGLQGWMYKVNGASPAVSAVDCHLSEGDQVWWFYSGAEFEGDLGLGANQQPVPTVSQDDWLQEALEKDHFEKVLDQDGEASLAFSGEKILEWLRQDKPLHLIGENWHLELPVESLKSEAYQEALKAKESRLELVVQKPTEASKALLQKASDASVKKQHLLSWELDLRLRFHWQDQEGQWMQSEIRKLEAPIALKVDLPESWQVDKGQLTGVLLGQDKGAKLQRLGGSYDSALKQWTFHTDETGLTALAQAQDLVNLSLWLGRSDLLHNGEAGAIDVAPILVEDRTQVPLRYIAESLGAKVWWQQDQGVVQIQTNEALITLKANLIVQGRTMVPLRYVSEELGALVRWFPKDQRVEVID